MSAEAKRLIVGISGASGMVYAKRLLEIVPQTYAIHLVLSEIASKIFKVETGYALNSQTLIEMIPAFESRKIHLYDYKNHFAAIASGSFRTDAMVVIPCSMKTLAGIAQGYAQSLLERAADVTLKEKRPLVLVVRETPYNRIHMKNMLKAHDAGATILPASPGFYHQPQKIMDLVDFVVARTLDALNIPQTLIKGWKEE